MHVLIKLITQLVLTAEDDPPPGCRAMCFLAGHDPLFARSDPAE